MRCTNEFIDNSPAAWYNLVIKRYRYGGTFGRSAMKKIMITAAAAVLCLCSCGNSAGSESSNKFSKDYEKAFIDYVETYNSFDAAKEMKYLYLDSLIDQLNDDQRKTIEDTLRDDYDEFRSLIKKYGEDARLEITDIQSEPLDAEALSAAKYFLCADYSMDSLKCDENSVSVSEGYEITADASYSGSSEKNTQTQACMAYVEGDGWKIFDGWTSEQLRKACKAKKSAETEGAAK